MSRACAATKARFAADATDPRHGTLNGYSNLDCRCQPCRDTWAAYCLQRRRERRAQEPRVHGSESTYGNWMCRCAMCRAAHAARARTERATA